ncbi:hypothetical protein EZV62_024163 [Acer yangbiense]|uniref:Uncharacterized protein n=1 Tax=Acer yangbiense TaxID=1000413 RepID=A0A5C7H4I9_9ROSI|nr:hypothetical protein EZV62_024163 [Acer yangbiense]
MLAGEVFGFDEARLGGGGAVLVNDRFELVVGLSGRVRKKVGVLADIDDLDNGMEIVNLLANEEFNKETVDMKVNLKRMNMRSLWMYWTWKIHMLLDKVSKKRKALNSKKLQGLSMRKKSKLASAEESVDLEDVENDVHVVKSGNSHRVHKKNHVKKDKSSDV